MTYRLIYTHRAARDIAALDPKTIEWYSIWRGRKSLSSEWGTGGRSIDGNLPSEAT